MPICTFSCKQSIAAQLDIDALIAATKAAIAKVMNVSESSVLISIPSMLACSEDDVTLLILAHDTPERHENVDSRALAISMAISPLIPTPLYVDIFLGTFGIASEGKAEEAKLLLD
ncbi:MAG: hypothetical protein ACK5MU_03440 [Candidatus Saccharimonadales bacterium]